MNQNFQWPQFLFIALFMGATVASWIFGVLRKQAGKKRARAEARQRYEEQLRTGRSPEQPTAQPSERRQMVRPPSPAQQLAARRQAQLAKLRQGQSGTSPFPTSPAPSAAPPLVRSPQTPMARPTGRPPRGVVIQRVPASTPPPVARPQPSQRRGPTPMTSRSLRTPSQGLERPPRSKLMSEPEPSAAKQAMRERQSTQPPPRRARKPRERAARVAAESAPTTPVRPAASNRRDAVRALLHAGAQGQPDQLRALFAVTEILGTPIGMRQEHEMSWARA